VASSVRPTKRWHRCGLPRSVRLQRLADRP
jgi:hypothetical protein